MKKDMELIRKILIALEDTEIVQGWVPLSFDGYSEELISYQIKILAEKGIISAENVSNLTGFKWHAKSLNGPGHDYLDAIRDDTRWQRVKEWVKASGKILTLEAIKEAGKALF